MVNTWHTVKLPHEAEAVDAGEPVGGKRSPASDIAPANGEENIPVIRKAYVGLPGYVTEWHLVRVLVGSTSGGYGTVVACRQQLGERPVFGAHTRE